MKYVYKVVYKGHSTFASDKLCLKYEIGKPTKAKIGRLFVFADLNFARNYVSNIGTFDELPSAKVLKCTYKGNRMVVYWVLRVNNISNCCTDFWASTKNFVLNSSGFCMGGHSGAVTVKSLTPREEV